MVATVLVAALGVQLGNWQSDRAEAKSGIEAAMTAATAAPPVNLNADASDGVPDEFRRVSLTGQFVAGWPIYLDNRPHEGASGFYVLMPFRLAASDRHVMVARGWAPRHVADRTRLPNVVTPKAEVTITGIVRTSMPRVMELGEPPALKPGAIVQNVAIPDLERATGMALLPIFVQQTGDAADGLVRDWPVPSSGIEKHRGYAFQWYGLALMAVLFFIVTGIRRESR